MLHNRFDLQRTYCPRDYTKVLRKLFTITGKPMRRFIALGCGNGDIFTAAARFASESCMFVGIEGGSLVGACLGDEFVHASMIISRQLQRPIRGIQKETLFSDSKHIIESKDNDKITAIHLYDGGILSKAVIEDVIGAISVVSRHSVMCFVTSKVKNILPSDVAADYVFIKRRMQRTGVWKCKRSYTFDVCENEVHEPTMQSLWFIKVKV